MSDQASAPLRIRLLGELDLRQGEAPVPPLGSARAESLLAYLVLNREAAQPRQRLAFLLWPDSSEPQARTNLRHLLHILRRALPGADRFLEATPRTLRWREGAPCWVDLAAFEGAISRADRSEGTDQEVASLREAVELYRGDLLQVTTRMQKDPALPVKMVQVINLTTMQPLTPRIPTVWSHLGPALLLQALAGLAVAAVVVAAWSR